MVAEDPDQSRKAGGVGETLLWRKRCKDELQAGKRWAGKYGFLLGDRLRANDSLEEFLRAEKIDPNKGVGSLYNMKPGRPRFGVEVDKQLGLLPITSSTNTPRGGVAQGGTMSSKEDSIQSFMESYLKKTGTLARPPPQSLYQKPVLSSHKYGWGKNLEIFGNMKLELK